MTEMAVHLILALSVLGTYSAAQERCVCPPGSFQGATGCKLCPAGTFQDEYDAKECKTCPQGFFGQASLAGSSECQICIDFDSVIKQKDPTKCKCQRGHKSRLGEKRFHEACQVVTCPKGSERTFLRYVRGFRCTGCLKGFFKPGVGTKCSKCPEGFSSQLRATKCISCKKAVRDKVFDVCGVCPAGQAFSNKKFEQCRDCKHGTFKAQDGTGECEKCPRGSYSWNGASECVKCNGRLRPLRRLKGKCGECRPREYYTPEDGSCLNCGRNEFAKKGNQLKCKRCPPGSFAPLRAGKCKRCPNGTVLKKNGRCEACPPGTAYNDGLNTCDACGLNQFSPGGVSMSCKQCSHGTFAKYKSASCFACPPGKAFVHGKGCTSCPAGSYYDKFTAECYKCDDVDGITLRSNVRGRCTPCKDGEGPNRRNTVCFPVCKIE